MSGWKKDSWPGGGECVKRRVGQTQPMPLTFRRTPTLASHVSRKIAIFVAFPTCYALRETAAQAASSLSQRIDGFTETPD